MRRNLPGTTQPIPRPTEKDTQIRNTGHGQKRPGAVEKPDIQLPAGGQSKPATSAGNTIRPRPGTLRPRPDRPVQFAGAIAFLLAIPH